MTEGGGLPSSVPAGPDAPAPASAPSRRPWVLPVLAVVVVAILVVAGLFATGIVRFGGASSASATYETFSQAESTAQSGAGAVSGAPWFAVLGAAISTPVAVLEPATNLSSILAITNCTFVWPNGKPSNVAIPATGPSAQTGAAAYWTFALKNASNVLLLESVSDGTASALLTASGGECTQLIGLLGSFPAGVVDSPAVISAANQVGGSAFLSAYPNATQVWGAIAGISYLGISSSPDWYVEYTSCGLSASVDENGSFFNATVGGTSGVVIGHSNGTAGCAPMIPGGLGSPVLTSAMPVAARKAI
jgi:hypothetical protein